jgi:hypothetical protein
MEAVFSNESIFVLRECVLIAHERHGFSLERAIERSGIGEDWFLDPALSRIAFDAILCSINWTEVGSVRSVVSIFMEAYAESPRSPISIHEKVDRCLRKDGFHILDGQLAFVSEVKPKD